MGSAAEPARSTVFESLDYLYTPSRDVAADMRYFSEVLGGRVVFAIEAMGTRVAMIELTAERPRIVLTDHLEGERTIFVYRVRSLRDAVAELEARGWRSDRSLEIPQGPVRSFTTVGGQRLAVYELTRPGVEASFEGRRDF
jgi:hypothetical protein